MASFSLLEQTKRLNKLAKNVPVFAGIKTAFGIPPAIKRPTGFPTLLKIILEQQVSLASADAVFKKLQRANARITPRTFLKWNDEELLSFGYSRQKRRYTRLLSEAVIERKFSFTTLESLPDMEARDYLTELKGIGPWSADVYLLMAEGRADFFPAGDIALQKAWQEVNDIETKPGTIELAELAAEWSPLRSAAAKWLWWFYLSKRNIPLNVDL